MWSRLVTLHIHIYVTLTVFNYSHYGYCKPFCRVDYFITLRLYAVVRGLFIPPAEDDFTNTSFISCALCLQIYQSEISWYILGETVHIPFYCIQSSESWPINFCVIIFGHYILHVFGQEQLHGLFTFKCSVTVM